MTDKQRKLLDAIIDECIRIDKSDYSKYYLNTLQIDWFCTYYKNRLSECKTYSEMYLLEGVFYDSVNPLRNARNSSRLADFFKRSPFSYDLRLYFRDLYIHTRTAEPFFFECEYSCLTLVRVLRYLRNM